MSVQAAFEIAATGDRIGIATVLRATPSRSAAHHLLLGIAQQYDGDVDGALRSLRHALRIAPESERAAIADLLGPILVMRDEPRHRAELGGLSLVLKRAGWSSSAHSFRAILAAAEGDRSGSACHAEAALRDLAKERSPVIRFRVLQRLARAAFQGHEHQDALDLAAQSADLCRRSGAWRAAAGSYSIMYLVHHEVTGDVEEADRCVRLWLEAARRTGDASFERGALVASFEIAVQLADWVRAERIERDMKKRLLPEQYGEQFAYAYSSALFRGRADLVGMRSILQILRQVPTRSRGEWALCTALVALAEAAQCEDVEAREDLRAACARLGRARITDPAYERRYRRMARAILSAVGRMLGDDVRARRIIDVEESRHGEGERLLPGLMSSERLAAADPRVRGLAAVLANAWSVRRAEMPPMGLTPAELSVLDMLSVGWTAGRIATETHRSVNTVYNHTRSLLAKLNVSRAAEAVARARALGILR